MGYILTAKQGVPIPTRDGVVTLGKGDRVYIEKAPAEVFRMKDQGYLKVRPSDNSEGYREIILEEVK